MQFNFKFFQTALLASVCLTSIYSADFAVVVDELLAKKPAVKPGEAVNNKDLRDRFFAEYTGNKEILLSTLVGIATIESSARSSHAEFLREAIAKSFFAPELFKKMLPFLTEKPEHLKLVRQLLSLSEGVTLAAQYTKRLPTIDEDEVVRVVDPRTLAFQIPNTLHVTDTDMPATLNVVPVVSTLPAWAQVYLLNVRRTLGSDDLGASVTKLDEALKIAQQQAIFDGTEAQIDQAANLVTLVETLRGVAPVISAYLKSVRTQITAIVPSQEKTVPGYVFGSYWTSSAKEDTEAQSRQRAALLSREQLAVSVFDAFTGSMAKSIAVPPSIAGIASSLDRAVGVLHATLPVTVPSRALTVFSSGLLGGESAHDDTAVICGETSVFMRQMWGAATMSLAAITEQVEVLDLSDGNGDLKEIPQEEKKDKEESK